MIFLSCGFNFFSLLQIIFNLYKTITNDITVYFWLRALYYKISAIIAICFRIITAVFLLWSLNLVWTQMFYFVSFVLFFLYMFYLCVIFSKTIYIPTKSRFCVVICNIYNLCRYQKQLATRQPKQMSICNASRISILLSWIGCCVIVVSA